MGRSLNGFCPKGHHISGANVLMRAGGYKGLRYKNCKKCYQARRRETDRLRYRNDDAYRAKILACRAALRKKQKEEAANVVTNVESSGRSAVGVLEGSHLHNSLEEQGSSTTTVGACSEVQRTQA